MEILTPEEKQKEKQLYRRLYTLLIILPIIALITVVGYFASQKSLLNQANEAIKAGNIEEAKEFAIQIDNLEMLDKNYETLLMVACEAGSAEMVEWAIFHGADPNFAPRGATTPLELYCSFGFRAGPKTLIRLLRAGADVQTYQFTPPAFCLANKLLYMTPEEREIAFEEIVILYESGDKMKHNDSTLFHYAAQYDNEPLAISLLQTTAGVKLLVEQDSDGKTPYDLALLNGSSTVQRLLRRFEENLLEELNKEPSVDEEVENTPPEDNKEELDRLINSLLEQSQNNTTPTENTTEENDTETEP